MLERNSMSSSSSRKSNKSKISLFQKTSAGKNSFIERRLGLEEDIATLKAKIALSRRTSRRNKEQRYVGRD